MAIQKTPIQLEMRDAATKDTAEILQRLGTAPEGLSEAEAAATELQNSQGFRGPE